LDIFRELITRTTTTTTRTTRVAFGDPPSGSKNAELRELLKLEPVSLVIKNGKLKWSQHVEYDANWVKQCIIDGNRER